MKSFILILLALQIFSCATQVVPVDIPNIGLSETTNIIDQRPDDEKIEKVKPLSLTITSEGYGTYRVGTKVVNPEAIRIFQHRVYEKFGDKGTPLDVKVHHLVVYSNMKSELRRGVGGALLGGAIGAVAASSTQKYGVDGLATIIDTEEFENVEKEFKRAIYTEEENPNKASVIFVYLDAEINGERKFVKTMTPLRFAKDDKRIPYIVGVDTAIAYYLDQY